MTEVLLRRARKEQSFPSRSQTTEAIVLSIAILCAAAGVAMCPVPLDAQSAPGANAAAVSGPGGSGPGTPMPGSEKSEKLNPEIYDAMYSRYLDSARQMATTGGRGPASFDWMASLSADPRARRINDLVTIRVIESIIGSGTADSQLNKNSAANVAVPKLFGLETKLPDAMDPAALVSASSDTKFKGGGVTTRSGELTAMMTARVVEVLPSGDLVLEGAREIDINGDRQIIVLTGVVRPIDIGRDNVVLSPAIGQLRIRYFGRGLMKDNMKPGWLVRALNKIF